MWNTTIESISNPLVAYWNHFVDYLPQLIGAIVILVVGLIVASVVGGIIKKLLSLGEENQRVQGFLSRWNINLKLAGFVGKFIWWVIFLVFISAAVEVLNVPVLTETINTLVAYLPQLFAAALIATVALFGARIVRSLVSSGLHGVGFKQGGLIGTIVYVALIVFGLTLAAAQLGIDTGLLTANITVIIAGAVLALALAFGLGGREAAARTIENIRKNTNVSTQPSKPVAKPVAKLVKKTKK